MISALDTIETKVLDKITQNNNGLRYHHTTVPKATGCRYIYALLSATRSCNRTAKGKRQSINHLLVDHHWLANDRHHYSFHWLKCSLSSSLSSKIKRGQGNISTKKEKGYKEVCALGIGIHGHVFIDTEETGQRTIKRKQAKAFIFSSSCESLRRRQDHTATRSK
jgi:hypothetical protein